MTFHTHFTVTTITTIRRIILLSTVSGLLFGMSSVSGCTMFNNNPPPQGPATQTCENIKQNISDNNAMYSVPGQYGNSPTVAAQLYKEYAHYNCPQLIEGAEKSPLPESYTDDKNVIKTSQ